MTLYAGPNDVLNLSIPVAAVQAVRAGNVVPTCQAVTDEFNTYFAARWGFTAVPLQSWDTSITLHAAGRVAFLLMRGRGLNEKSPDWAILSQMNAEALDFVNKVQRQQAHPTVILATGLPPGPIQPNVTTGSVVNIMTGFIDRNRGW
jgi:hypothetical protein